MANPPGKGHARDTHHARYRTPLRLPTRPSRAASSPPFRREPGRGVAAPLRPGRIPSRSAPKYSAHQGDSGVGAVARPTAPGRIWRATPRPQPPAGTGHSASSDGRASPTSSICLLVRCPPRPRPDPTRALRSRIVGQPPEESTPPTIFRSSWARWAEMLLLGLIAVGGGWLLLVTTTPGSPLMFPVVAPIIVGSLALLLVLDRVIRPTPELVVDDQGLTFSPFGRIPWAAISRIHLITAHGTRYLAVELVDRGPKVTESRWPRWILGPIGRLAAGYPRTLAERWLRPVSLDDIAAELHSRNPSLIITRSERGGFRRTRP